MMTEYRNKMKQYQAEADTTTDEENKKRGLEVQTMEQSIQQFQGQAQQDLQTKNETLMKPIFEKAKAAISKVAKAQGFDYVLDSTQGSGVLVSDGKDLSTPTFINHISSSMGFSARLFPVPIFLLKFLFNILGKKKELDRLIGSLKLDSTHTREALNWIPPVNIAEGIRRMVQGK